MRAVVLLAALCGLAAAGECCDSAGAAKDAPPDPTAPSLSHCRRRRRRCPTPPLAAALAHAPRNPHSFMPAAPVITSEQFHSLRPESTGLQQSPCDYCQVLLPPCGCSPLRLTPAWHQRAPIDAERTPLLPWQDLVRTVDEFISDPQTQQARGGRAGARAAACRAPRRLAPPRSCRPSFVPHPPCPCCLPSGCDRVPGCSGVLRPA